MTEEWKEDHRGGDTELLHRAILRAPRAAGSLRWQAVMGLLNTEEDFARTLCARFRFDPDEILN